VSVGLQERYAGPQSGTPCEFESESWRRRGRTVGDPRGASVCRVADPEDRVIPPRSTVHGRRKDRAANEGGA
jgi:hypothetical protein